MQGIRGDGRLRSCLHYCPIFIVVTIAALFIAAVVSTTLVTKMAKHTSAAAQVEGRLQGVLQGHHQSWFTYTSMGGFFLQDEPNPDPAKIGFADPDLGLIKRAYATDHEFDPTGKRTQWERFANYVRHLDATAPKAISYKVLFLGRHGEGWHNVEEADVGGKLWDCYWSRLDGNGNITWANAELTPLGVNQALTAHAWWKTALTEAKVPPPESYYVSPLQRCLMTSNYTFTGLALPPDKQFKPIIKEFFREFIGVHTCDRRDAKSEIQSLWPAYSFEGNFSETDNLWDPDYRENGSMNINRMKLLLDDIFTEDRNTFISGTSHGGSIGSLLYGIGHTNFALNTGGVVPVFLKAVRGDGPRPTPTIDPVLKDPACPSPAPTAASKRVLTKQVDTRL